MSKIGIIGVGNMGAPMAVNLVKAGFEVTAFDLSQGQLDKISQDGVKSAATTADAVGDADIIITMLPAGEQVKAAYLSEIFPNARPGALMIDCSTIDVDTARLVHTHAADNGFAMLDAPVSGGVGGAVAGTLTFMVGGTDEAFDRAGGALKAMGKNIVYCGGAGNGQAAKVCNNMMLGIQMASVAEGFTLAKRLGLDAEKLFNVSSTASGQCWSLTNYCPVPGLVPTSPANNNFEPGFATALMLKDMNLALDAARSSGANVSVAEQAASLYRAFAEAGGDGKDFSAIIEHVKALSDD